jgi:hypothetical protein
MNKHVPELALEIDAARWLMEKCGPRMAAAYLRVRGWSMASALAVVRTHPTQFWQ